MSTSESSMGIRELFNALTRDFSTLIKQQIALAKREATDNVKRTLLNSGFLIGGALGAMLGASFLFFGASFALGQIFVSYGSSLLMGIFYGFAVMALLVGGISTIFIFKGLHTLKERSLTPERTVESIKEDGRWAKQKFQETIS